MLTLNMTAGNDSDIIWIVKITGDNETYLLASEDITLSGNNYDGKVLFLPERLGSILSDVEETVDLTNGGTIGNIGNFSFGISRYNSNPLLQNSFNEFYPATSGQRIIAAQVDLGVVWSGATTESQITWFEQGYIKSYSYDPRVMYFDCEEKNELVSLELPYYAIQKDYDNGISYFPNAPLENLGSAIPIVYGSFKFNYTVYEDPNNLTSWITETWGLVPTVLTEPGNLVFIIASHICKTAETAVYKYINGYRTYMRITGNSSLSNSEWGCLVDFQLGNTQATGEIRILLKELSSYSDITNVNNIINLDKTDYSPLAGNQKVALRIGGSASTSEVGAFPASGYIAIFFAYVSATGTFILRLGEKDNISQTDYYADTNLGSSAPQLASVIINNLPLINPTPFTIEKLSNYEYYILTDPGATANIYYAYLTLSGIIVSQVKP